MNAIVIHAPGGPEVLRWETVPEPVPGPGQVLVQNAFIGVNYVDLQHRRGQPYPVSYPLIPGTEATGVVRAVGQGTSLAVGTRVGYAGYMGGNYAEMTVVPEDRLVPVPEGVPLDWAAASLLQGMTAHALVRSVFPVQPGHRVLVHSAGSGVGWFTVQWAKALGAQVVGTVSRPERQRAAEQAGCDEVVCTLDPLWPTQARERGTEGFDAVFDAVGRDTFDQSLGLLKTRGTLVVYGLSSGLVPPFDINRLSGITGGPERGSLLLTWATLNDYNARPLDLQWRARDLFEGLQTGLLRCQIEGVAPLAEAAMVHDRLERHAALGKWLLRAETVP